MYAHWHATSGPCQKPDVRTDGYTCQNTIIYRQNAIIFNLFMNSGGKLNLFLFSTLGEAEIFNFRM